MRIWPRPFISLSVLLAALLLTACQTAITMPASAPDTAAEPAPAAEEAAPAEAAEEPAADEPQEEPPAELHKYVFQSETSEVRYIIDETLAGNAKRVVGASSALSGSVTASPARLQDTEFAPIVIDSGSFVTDADRRDGAVRRMVLSSAAFPEIVFQPHTLSGAPDAAAIGEEIEFELTGLLRIRESEVDVTFAVSAAFASETELQGSGSATVRWEEHGVRVPMPPLVTWVDEFLTLEIDFHAVAE